MQKINDLNAKNDNVEWNNNKAKIISKISVLIILLFFYGDNLSVIITNRM